MKKKIKIKEKKKPEKNIFIILGFMAFCILLFLIAYLMLKDDKSFVYKGIRFSKYKYSDKLMLYRFPVQINVNDAHANYTFYLRKDPRQTKSNFNGTINLKKYLTINVNGSFDCNGDGLIAISNIQQLYQRMNMNVYGDRNTTCNSTSPSEMLLTISQGNKTELIQNSDNCYTVYVKDCEILEGTEQFVIETVAKLNLINKELNK